MQLTRLSARLPLSFLGMPRPNLPDQYDVYDPVTGNRITDIDTIYQGYLTEEKSATRAMDNEGFASKLVAQLSRYINARVHTRLGGCPC
jgi:hypothetical protein